MSRLIVVFIVVVALTAGATPAAAQQGNGPYAPFPAGPTGSQAEQYYAQLGVVPSAKRIGAGAFLGGLAAPRATGEASHRAGVAQGGAGILALLVALVLVAGALATTRRRGSAVPT